MRLLKSLLPALLQFILLFCGTAYLIHLGAESMGYQWQWSRVPDYLAFYEDGQWWPAEILEGLWVTIQIAAVSLLFTLVIGLLTALLRLSDSLVGRGIAKSYIELIRNTPLLVQIYLLYFVFGPVLGLDRFASAVLALALFQGAYTAEIIRGGLMSIPKGQFEAIQTLGLSRFAGYRLVILPQLLQRILPSLTNEVVSLIKNSSIVSVMAIFDLTTVARDIISETAMPFEIWFTIAGIYLLLTFAISAFAAFLERQFGAQWRSR